MKLVSYKNRPVHLGPYPMESIPRIDHAPAYSPGLKLEEHGTQDKPSASLAHPLSRYLAMTDAVRYNPVRTKPAIVTDNLSERANHIKSAAYYYDASMVGICELSPSHMLVTPKRNPLIDTLIEELEQGPPDGLPEEYKQTAHPRAIEAAKAPWSPLEGHTHAIIMLVEHPRDPRTDEAGTEWFKDAQAERGALLAATTATVIADYLRLLGYEARPHSETTCDVDLAQLAVCAGLASTTEMDDRQAALVNPFVGKRFSLAVVTTSFAMAPDKPLDPSRSLKPPKSLQWYFGGQAKRADSAIPYQNRDFRLGPHPFETLKRIDKPTSLIDEERVARVPKRADYFMRAHMGDFGPSVQKTMQSGIFIGKSPIGACATRLMGVLLLLQYGGARNSAGVDTADKVRNSENLRGASYFLSVDAVGLSRAPDWVYYSHDAMGNEITPYHDHAISLMLDQGHETMEGASGDDWVSAAQSMRAYMRFQVLGGVIAEQLRRLGYDTRVHSTLDGDVLQPPLMLLSGLGEISRIGDVMINPFLGPRLKSGVITTDMPIEHDKPIDFGMQNFCDSCQKCARECPSGAITAGPKVMFNGYEIWRSDAEKCTRYRLSNEAGSMCGRCMKTCPWNLEGLFVDGAFRWLAMNAPSSAKMLAALDDKLGRGDINPVKKWWWDIEINERGDAYGPARQTAKRGLTTTLILKREDQSLAAYPADAAPQSVPIAQPFDRDAGIERYDALLSPTEYKKRLKDGQTENLVPKYEPEKQTPVGMKVEISQRQDLSDDIFRLEIQAIDGKLPPVEAGAHIDVVVSPGLERQYSLMGDPADRTKYVLGIQREAEGRGGSKLLHRRFKAGHIAYISPPRNHFPLDESASLTLLMAGGIGVTPMIAMAHRLHAIGKDFLFHFSAKSAVQSGFAEELKAAPWADKVFFHFSQETGRADFADLIPNYRAGFRLYTCGGEAYMNAVFATAEEKGWPEEAKLREFFSAPEGPEYENSPFTLKLQRSRKTVEVPADQTAVEALASIGIEVETKCSDGICGVCACGYSEGDVEHRDYVLSKKDKENTILLCCSRAKKPNGEIIVDL